VKELRDRGVTLIPGTDLGGSFTYHRELELYQRIGATPAEILAWATLDMARYLGQDQRLGRSRRASWPTSSWCPATRRATSRR
jgi:imidazolonepropionase-like amidohydrolase